jgi:hypothetical protein
MPDGQFIPPRSKPMRPFLLGRNRAGQWVVQDEAGMWGGIFVDRIAALKFAMSENGRPQAVIMVPHLLELDIKAPSKRPVTEAAQAPGAPQRAA